MRLGYGTFLRQVRTSRGLSQVQLARTVGIEQPNLSAYENDRQVPSMDMLNRILVGCGYLLEAVAGERRIVCLPPSADWVDEKTPWSESGTTTAISSDRTSVDERALQLEQVLALADALLESRALS
jgi:transcriptional regulator with XRE-family HTH domain